MEKINNYNIGGKEIQFNVTEFLSNSKNVARGFNYTLNENVNKTELKVKLETLKPIQECLDMNDVIMNIARKKPLNESMVITNDFYVVSENSVLASKVIIEENDSFVDVVMIDKSINQILEDYGMQGGEASGGMGDVVLPSVSGSSEMPKMDGSGDIPATKKKDEENDFYTEETLLKYAKKFEDLLRMKFPINESVSTPLEVPLKSELMSNEDLLKKLENTFFVKFIANDTTNEDANLKLDCHFNSSKDVENDPNIETFVNRPIARRVLKVDVPFSCNTLEGITQGKAGDYVVIGVDGEIYPCDAEILHKTYIKVE